MSTGQLICEDLSRKTLTKFQNCHISKLHTFSQVEDKSIDQGVVVAVMEHYHGHNYEN